MLRDFKDLKPRLLNLNGIRIECIPSWDADFASFLRDCTPNCLRLLAVNCNANSHAAVNRSFTQFAVEGCSSGQRNLLQLHRIQRRRPAEGHHCSEKFTENCVQLLLIHCSSLMDFEINRKCSTEYLSFQLWGSARFDERTTEWKTDPSCFSRIVKGIWSSGLRARLRKVNIKWNKYFVSAEGARTV